MSETSFTVKGNGVGRVRLEPTNIIGMGSSANPQLVLPLKFQLLPLGPTTYTLLRVSGKIFVGNENHPVASAEHPSIAEDSMPSVYDRTVNLSVPLTVTQIKHIEDLRSGGNLLLRIVLSGLVFLKQSSDPKQTNEFERLQDMNLQVAVPRSHWIDTALKAWGVSDLRLLEISFSEDSRKEMALVRTRLADAEQLYRIGDYTHVLTELRSAFSALAERYGTQQADKNMFDKALSDKHPKMRAKLRDSFHHFCNVLDSGPHEPSPTQETPTPISRQDARFALVVAHAIFEYFSAENWPGI